MHNELDRIKSLESSPKVIKNFINAEEANQFLRL